ncbi:helix-turn-helix domain-containing protein [Nitrolancea hollandica]|uniref:HTH cro/C1-type domain-containing protein n=1 Tax=Nitrolancea hollandica Lb TaxID=1129897 RepID=I4EGF5_9BACT|nr:XRE family transcriptional regulator [Nitrolancea hollandica]CCF83767.1 conserved hypothetical protein [Nitrolancea hollandica Lb]
MDAGILQAIDPRELGRRLQEARKMRGSTQQEAAEQLGVARTTLTAIEKGERRVQPNELIRLAAFYGRSVGEFLRRGEPTEPFSVQFRAALAPFGATEVELNPYLGEFHRLCEDYLELERLCGSPLSYRYPPIYEIKGVSPEAAAADVAASERNRLSLGDGPVVRLRELLEDDVGLRIFSMNLPSRIAAMFAYTDRLGGCIAVNRKHPAERRRHSVAHEYGHFLSQRYRPEVIVLGRYQRQPEHERFAEAFARMFLMPSAGLKRRFHELHRDREGRITPADLCRLAARYAVSVEALTRRLEELQLLPMGTWDRLSQAGFKVREAQELLHLEPHPGNDQLLPTRYLYLAAEAYERGDLSEGQLARFLRTDRLEARRIVAELAVETEVSGEGTVGMLPLNLGETLPTRGA